MMKLPRNYNHLNFTDKWIVREEYIKKQSGKCCFCGGSLGKNPRSDSRSLKIDMSLFPPNFFVSPIHLHHNHDTGMTIGAVHAHCNAVL